MCEWVYGSFTQHGLREDSHESHGLHEPVHGQHQICYGSSDGPHDQHKVQIRLEVCPAPEVLEVKICGKSLKYY